MGQAHLTRLGPPAAADQPRRRDRVVRRAERPARHEALGGSSPATLRSASSRGLAGRERRQDRRQPLRQQRLARPGRADHQHVVAARRRDFHRALGVGLAAHVAEVDVVVRRLDREELPRIPPEPCRSDRSSSRNAAASASQVTGYTASASSTDASEVLPAARRHRPGPRGSPGAPSAGAAHGMDGPVEGQLPHHEQSRQPIGLDRARRGQEPERDRQVEAHTFLPQIGRGEIDRDALEREREAGACGPP